MANYKAVRSLLSFLLILSLCMATSCTKSNNKSITTLRYKAREDVTYYYGPGYDTITHQFTGTRYDTQYYANPSYIITLQLEPEKYVVYSGDTFTQYATGEYIHLPPMPQEKTIYLSDSFFSVHIVERTSNVSGYATHINANRLF